MNSIDSNTIVQTILDTIQQNNATTPIAEPIFNTLALELYHYQRVHNPVYRAYCDRVEAQNPDLRVEHWSQIPAVVTDAFKYARLSTSSDTNLLFRTSGTTHDGRRGVHHFQTLDLYRAAALPAFEQLVMPGGAPLPFLMLAPPATEVPDSSLSFMMQELAHRYGTSQSRFFGNLENDLLVFDFDRFGHALTAAVEDNTPVFVMGTAFAWLYFFDSNSDSWQLPSGSRLLETGGFKGRTREFTKEELYSLFNSRLGLPNTHLISEYSMTELSSQAYSDNLQKQISWEDAHLVVPPWVRILVVDPETMLPLASADGATNQPLTGLIRWIDLANTGSVLSIQTSDVGTLFPDGSFILHGRAKDADLRGCSIMVEELIKLK